MIVKDKILLVQQRVSDKIKLPTNELDSNIITDVKFVSLDKPNKYGFSDKFIALRRIISKAAIPILVIKAR